MSTNQLPNEPVPQGDRALPLLAKPEEYVACRWDLRAQPAMRAYWLGVFRVHFPTLVEEARREALERGQNAERVAQSLAAVTDRFLSYLNELSADPGRFGRPDILSICLRREQELRRAGFADPYRLTKQRENEACLAVLPVLLNELDAMTENDRGRRLIEGVFAGNLDLGATSTLHLYQSGGIDFHAVRAKLSPRPWLVDDLEGWLERWRAPRRHRQALMFVDNAGSDVVLGMIPLARELLRRGTRVILTANSFPSLNDVTWDELARLIGSIAALDATIADAVREGRLDLMPSGNGLPLIDLKRISPELAETAQRLRPDLLILEGMGRALESNYDTPMTCDTLKVAMIKDRGVAAAMGGKLYDLVLRYEAGR